MKLTNWKCRGVIRSIEIMRTATLQRTSMGTVPNRQTFNPKKGVEYARLEVLALVLLLLVHRWAENLTLVPDAGRMGMKFRKATLVGNISERNRKKTTRSFCTIIVNF